MGSNSTRGTAKASISCKGPPPFEGSPLSGMAQLYCLQSATTPLRARWRRQRRSRPLRRSAKRSESASAGCNGGANARNQARTIFREQRRDELRKRVSWVVLQRRSSSASDAGGGV